MDVQVHLVRMTEFVPQLLTLIIMDSFAPAPQDIPEMIAQQVQEEKERKKETKKKKNEKKRNGKEMEWKNELVLTATCQNGGTAQNFVPLSQLYYEYENALNVSWKFSLNSLSYYLN